MPALIAPSDHLITEEDAFNEASRDMLEQLHQTPDSMVVLGAEPTRFDASLGYIHTKGGDDAVQVIDSFHEKPDEDVVAELGESGNLYWNTACYGVRVGRACEAYRGALPLIFESIERTRAAPPPSGPTAVPPSVATRSTRSCGPAWSASSSRGSSGGPTSAPGPASSGCSTTSG